MSKRSPQEVKAHIVHLSTVHPANDTRIFVKECMTLASAGYEVTLVARPPRAEFDSGPVEVIELAFPGGRLGRMILGPFKVLRLALSFRADLYHFHDPELIPVGIILKVLQKRVIYDVHEDVPAQIMNKDWIPGVFRRPVAGAVSLIHRIANIVFDGIVVAREDAAKAFRGDNVALIQNYPILSEFANSRSADSLPSTNPYRIVYVGGITRERGIKEMIDAVEILAKTYNVVFELAGPMSANLKAECERMPGWQYVRYHAWVDRNQMSELLADSSVALLIFHPIANHVTSYPNKLFEYMSAGVPIVASDFAYWQQYVTDVGSGIQVDPMNPAAIAGAVETIMNDRDLAESMGKAGVKAVHNRWNWDADADALMNHYQLILQSEA